MCSIVFVLFLSSSSLLGFSVVIFLLFMCYCVSMYFVGVGCYCSLVSLGVWFSDFRVVYGRDSCVLVVVLCYSVCVEFVVMLLEFVIYC